MTHQVRASMFEADSVILVGKVTSVSTDEVVVECSGEWGRAVFELPDSKFEEYPNIGDDVEVVLLGRSLRVVD